ncbi:MAG: ASKHA domain-containing protein [Anaerolineae bacterium]
MRVRFEPSGVTTEVEAGVTLLQAAIAAGVEIVNVCGGRGTCGKCKVIATHGLSAPNSTELRKLTQEELTLGYRLACQAVIEGNVDVVVPDESRVSRVSILHNGVHGDHTLEPWALRCAVQVQAALLEDQTPDLENVSRAWHAAHGAAFRPTLRVIRDLPKALRAVGGLITAVMVDGEAVRVEGGHGPANLLGIAFDIGTTSVVGYLMDLESGEQLAVSSVLNPQTRYGDDVVTRIDYTTREPEGLQNLQREIVQALNKIIGETTAAAQVSAGDIYAMTVVGNTTMHHLFLGISPAALAQAPYVPAVRSILEYSAEQLGIAICPDAHVWVLPNIAGWVGADTVGVILASGIFRQDELALAIDIGTNGEMAMGSNRRLVTCSTAAGPAFEGAQLSCGMRAADGAIDVVSFDGDVHWHAIGDAPPRGVCGSGLVDLVAAMLHAGIIDEMGAMQDGDALRSNGQAKLAERMFRVERHREFHLATAAEGAGGRPVRVTQRDVRELQLAKGAIRAGIEILMKELGIQAADVQRVYLAGAFGNYIRPESALEIGLMPRFPNAEIVPIGNAAGSGAKMALLSLSARNEAADLPARVEYLELSGRPDFQEEFMEAMVF